jgi:hypothetical protein
MPLTLTPTPHIQDLRRTFYGGGRDAEYAFFLEAARLGVTASDLLAGIPSLGLIIANQQGNV